MPAKEDILIQIIIIQELASVLAGIAECRTLLVGRWALDVTFAEMISPTPRKIKEKGADDDEKKEENSKEKGGLKETPKFPPKLVFVAPPAEARVHSDVLKREPHAVDLSRTVRMKPMVSGRGDFPRPRINFALPLYRQSPPICFVH